MKILEFFKSKGVACYNDQRNKFLTSHYKELNEEEKNEAIALNIGLVYNIVNRLSSQNFSSDSDFQEELLCLGIIGLQKALNTYDVTKKAAFSSYASTCIRNEILMYLRKYNKYNGNELSIERIINDQDQEKNSYIFDILYASTVSSNDEALNELYYELLQQWMEELPLEDQLILQKLYGLGDNEKTAQWKLAQELGISQGLVSYRQKKIIKKLRDRFIDEGVIAK